MSVAKLLTDTIKPWCNLFVNSINVETDGAVGNVIVSGDLVVEEATSFDGVVYNTGYRGSFGGLSGIPTNQTFAAANVYQDLSVTTIPITGDSVMFIADNLTTNPRLEYIGEKRIKCSVFSNIWVNTLSSAALQLAVFVNGILINRSGYTRITLPSVGPPTSLTCYVDDIELQMNDIIEVKILNTTTNNCILYGFSVQVTSS